MSFNDGFSSRGVDSISGSDGEILTRVAGQWVSAPNLGSGAEFPGIVIDPTNPNLEGLGTALDPLKVKPDLNITSVTGSFSGDGSQLTNLPLSNYATKTDVTGAIDDALVPYATLTGVSASFTTPSQVTSALAPYATLSGVSASFARIDIDNNFVGNQNVTGYISASNGLTGSSFGVTAQYTDITASNITASDLITNYINFKHSTDPAWENGRLWYNNATHELNYWTEVNGFNVKLGQQLVQRCQNDQGAILTKGAIVQISGSSSSDTPRIRLADWTNDGLSANTLGLVAEDIAIGDTGYVIVQGIIKGINTNSYNPGQILYLSSSGQITGTKPTAPKHSVSIGQVVRKQNVNGSIYVSIQNGYELSELHDVLTNGKSNNDLFIWDSSIPAWKNSNTLGGYTFSGVNTFQNSISGTSAYFNGNLTVNGTASIGLLETISQSSLAIGDKYIVLMSGGVDHVDLDGAGILYGSGSTGPTVDPDGTGANAYIKFRNAYDKLEVFPGLRVSGSLTASNGISGSFIGDGSGIINIPSTAVDLSAYATLTGVSGTFGSKADLTASYARLGASNTFTQPNTFTVITASNGNYGSGSFTTASVGYLYTPSAVFGQTSSLLPPQSSRPLEPLNNSLLVGEYTGSANPLSMLSPVSESNGAWDTKLIVSSKNVGSAMVVMDSVTSGSAWFGTNAGNQVYFGGYNRATRGPAQRVNFVNNGGTNASLSIENNRYLMMNPKVVMAQDSGNAVFYYSGANRNPYVDTAVLHVTGSTIGAAVFFSSASIGTASVRISQYGQGDALIVEDEISPDSTPFVIKNDGRVVIGDYTGTSGAKLEVIGNISASAGISGSHFGDGSGLTNVPTSLTLTTNGLSGSATLVGSTLNIPKYVGLMPPLSSTEVFRGATYRNNSTITDTYGGLTISTNGSATAQLVASTNYQTKQIRMKYAASAVSTGRYTGIRDGALWYIGGGFRYVCGFGVTDTVYDAGCRQFYGMSTSSVDLTYDNTITVASLTNLFGVGSDAADTNLQIFYNDSAGTASKIDLGSNFPANRTAGAAMTTMYYVELYNPPGTSNIIYKVTNGELNVSTEGILTTDLPSNTSALNCFASRCMGGPVTGTGEFCLTRFGVYSI